MAVPSGSVESVVENLRGTTPTAAVIGGVVEGPPGTITVD